MPKPYGAVSTNIRLDNAVPRGLTPGRDPHVTTETDFDAALRADIRRLGILLGQTLARQEGQGLLDLVEEVRGLVRTDAEAAFARLAQLDIGTVTDLARAFSTYFHLANVTEQVHRARELRRERAAEGGWLDRTADLIREREMPPAKIAAAVARLAIWAICKDLHNEAASRSILAK